MVRPERDLHQSILDLLRNLRGLDALKEIPLTMRHLAASLPNGNGC